MKKLVFGLLTAAILVSCEVLPGDDNPENNLNEYPQDEQITVTLPSPTVEVKSVGLDEAQRGYVNAGNSMGFRMLEQLYEGKNMVFSPLSLQYALAMTANGASGETLQEIIDFLGYGDEGIDALNAYNRILMEELPAVDLENTLKVTNALLVRDDLRLLPSFRETVSSNYYAAVENCSFADPEYAAARVNEWASRNTDGFIDKVLMPDDFNGQTLALIMNALYFKAKWAGSEGDPMFWEESTREEPFTCPDGVKVPVQMMHTMKYFPYAEMDGYMVVALPFRNYKYYMYFLLPTENDIDGLIARLPDISWKELTGSFKRDAEVYVSLPKFEIEERYNLNETLGALGIRKPFQAGDATFDRMFDVIQDPWRFWIGNVIQKAKIAVTEWGTEAGAVTVVMMAGSAFPGEEPKRVYFTVDHPFVFAIGEASSGTLLFQGVFSGK